MTIEDILSWLARPGKVAHLWGAPCTGKTALATRAAMRVVADGGKVIYITDSPGPALEKLQHFINDEAKIDTSLFNIVHVDTFHTMIETVVALPLLFTAPQVKDSLPPFLEERLGDVLEAAKTRYARQVHPPRLIIVDEATRLYVEHETFKQDHDWSKELSLMVATLKHLATTRGFATCLVNQSKMVRDEAGEGEFAKKEVPVGRAALAHYQDVSVRLNRVTEPRERVVIVTPNSGGSTIENIKMGSLYSILD